MHPGILLDLQGPKIRLGTFEGGEAVLVEGATFTITVEQVQGTQERASISYSKFGEDVKPGDKVLIADGSVELARGGNGRDEGAMCGGAGRNDRQQERREPTGRSGQQPVVNQERHDRSAVGPGGGH